MEKVGVRELKQSASQVLSAVENGASYVVTVQGREVGQLIPIGRNSWVAADRMMTLFDVPVDADFWADLNRARENSAQDDPWQTP